MIRLKHSFLVIGILFGLAKLTASLLPLDDVNGDYIVRGRYDSSLGKLDKMWMLDEFMEKQFSMRNIHPIDTAQIVFITDSILQERFYHGTSRYNLSDNWIAFISGVILWDDLRMIVTPDHLMQKKTGTCNQLTILFHRLLKKRNIVHRAVGLNQHMVTEVWYDGNWHMYDPDYEPLLNHNMSVNDLLDQPDSFQKIYSKTEGSHFNKNFASLLNTKTAHYYPRNIELAVNLRGFHHVSSFLSEYGWIIFSLIGLIFHFLKPCAG